MPKFRVYGILYATKEIAIIEAETKEDAIKKGWEHENCEPCTLCWQCREDLELDDINEVRADEIKED